jgi:hypothetical protein
MGVQNQNFSKVGTGINSFGSTTPLRRLEQFFGPFKKRGEVKWFPLCGGLSVPNSHKFSNLLEKLPLK